MRARDLELRDLSCRFGQVQAAAGVSLRIPAGSYVVLLGPSGSGKTTLLSILGGFTRPSSGRVLFAGEDITTLPPARRPTATVFQDYALFPRLGVARDAGFGLSVRGRPKEEIARAAAAALELVGLPGLGARRIGQLSGGRRQRVALARALVIAPASSCSIKPWAPSTSTSAGRCGTSRGRCSGGRGGPSSTSPTTRKRRWRSPIWSW
ncbi:MAG: ABC transporter ATP-binding protein [Geminicoccaceae bacterium]|nr:ABC transporter ATP-binding protein [Geminicoccaceae bacterium]